MQATVITLRIEYAQRLTPCTKELRTLRYRAEIDALTARTHDLTVVHEESGRRDTMLVQRIDVR